MRLDYLVPRAAEYGGIQRFAHDAAESMANRHDVNLIDLGASRASQRIELAKYSLRQLAPTRKGHPIIHHWHVASAALPTLPADVVTCHGTELLHSRWRVAARHALQRTKFVMCNSGFVARIVEQEFDVHSSRIVVVPPAVSRAAIDAGQRSRILSAAGPLQLGFLARFVERKNALRVIDAAQLLHLRQGVDLVLHVAGDGPQRMEVLDRLTRSGVPHRYWGALDDMTKFEEFYPSLEIFVSPSLNLTTDAEGFGITYLEANAFGVPVIAARTGGAGDAVREGRSGYFVDPLDAESIASGILELATRRRALEGSSRSWAEQFDVAHLGDRLNKLYDRIAR